MSELGSLSGLAASLLVGGMLLYAGVGKLRARASFQATLHSYAYVPAAFRGALSILIPGFEVGLGLALAAHLWPTLIAPSAIALLAVLSVAFASKAGLRGKSDCGCFGGHETPVPTLLILGRNLSLIVLVFVAWAGGSDLTATGGIAVSVAFFTGALALGTSLLGSGPREANSSFQEPLQEDRRRFLKVAGSMVTGLIAAGSLALLEGRRAEAACYGCGTCGTDYVFLYCTSPCCAMYWVRPYNYCQTSCPACSPKYQTSCGVSSCC